MVFCESLVSINLPQCFQKFIHVASFSTSCSLWLNNIYCRIYHVLFIHLSADDHWVVSFVAIMNNAADIHIQVFVWTYDFHFFWV